MRHLQNSNKRHYSQAGHTTALWQQAFRPFFLAGALFSIVALTLWVAVLMGWWFFTPYGNSVFWHAHEMLFGFVGAIIVGFLLTAVQNWTNQRAVNGWPLIALFSLWLLARVLMAMGWSVYPWLIIIVDISFFLSAAVLMARLVINAKNYRNLFFVPILVLLSIANFLTHLSIIDNEPSYFSWGMHSAIMLVILLIVAIAGRVLPMFTANGTQTQKVNPLPWLEKMVMLSTATIVMIYLVNGSIQLPTYLLSGLFLLAASCHSYRAYRWYCHIIWSVPLVWSLHVAYWFIPLGFGLLALHFAGIAVSFSAAVHVLTTGAMGALILAMIARVSLGHTGRPLILNKVMVYGFLLIVLAAIIRLFTGLYPALIGVNGYLLTVVLWGIAYGLYSISYYRILTRPRIDGREG